MKTRFLPSAAAGLAAVLGAATLTFTGCKTAPPSQVWSDRVGHYSYQQAVADMGTPVETKKLNDGDLMAMWAQRGPPGDNVVSFSSNRQTPYNATEDQFPDKSHNQVLALTFDTNDVLVAWQMNY